MRSPAQWYTRVASHGKEYVAEGFPLPTPARVFRPNFVCQEHRNIMKEFNEDFEIKRVPRPGE